MKYCNKCKQHLSNDMFGKNKSTKDGMQSQCKVCRKDTNNKHYANSQNRKNAIRRNAINLKDRNIQYLNEIKSKGCCKCGENELCTLDFHHLNQNKDFDLSKKKDRYSIEKLKEEISKCIVVCSNCHRKIHSGIISELG